MKPIASISPPYKVELSSIALLSIVAWRKHRKSWRTKSGTPFRSSASVGIGVVRAATLARVRAMISAVLAVRNSWSTARAYADRSVVVGSDFR